jgi:hypothetical protein
MKLRQAMTRQPTLHGPVSRLVAFLSLRGFTAFDALMIPFHFLFASIMLATPADHIQASPVYSRCTEVAPIWVWAWLLILLAACIVVGIAWERWRIARAAYIFIAAWWFSIGGLVYLVATTLLSPAVYVLIGVVCLYRQAEIAVGYEYGRE